MLCLVLWAGAAFAALKLAHAPMRVPSFVTSYMTAVPCCCRCLGCRSAWCTCVGPQPFMDSLDSTLKQLGVPAGHIFTENFKY